MTRLPGWIKVLILGLPLIWLLLFFVLPFLQVARLSLSAPARAQPPYRPVFELEGGLGGLLASVRQLGLDNFATLAGDGIYVASLLSSLRLAAIATLALLLIGYPLASAMARAPQRLKPLLLALVILPFWTSFLIRVYAWIGILRQEGYLNWLLLRLGLVSEPITFLDTDFAIVLGIVYAYLPFMALPLFAAVDKLDRSLIEAAQDLGCPPWLVFWRVTLPLTLPAAAAGSLLVFIPAVGEIIIPDLLGGSDTLMIGRMLWAEFFSNSDWPLASALALLLLAVLLPPILAYRRLEERRWRAAA